MTLEEALAEITRLTAANTDLTGENTRLQGVAEAAQGNLRNHLHQAAFRETAIAKGVLPEAAAALYTLSGYQPAGDDIDADGMGELIESKKAALGFCWAPPAAATTQASATPPAAPKPAPAGSQGRGSEPRAPGKYRVTKAQTADLAWMFANSAAYNAAAANGTLEIC